ncbi:hypothetical protein MMC15_001918 [Xylographa vitiligo]|nr:hypothetical protein [Xylographa vitiligo]
MPATDSPAIIVARFLKANHYDQTLDAFISEAGLEPDAGSIEKGDLTIEKILEEKKVFDLSVRFEKFGDGNGQQGWTVPGAVFIRPSSAPYCLYIDIHISVSSDRAPIHDLPKALHYISKSITHISTAPSEPTIVTTLPTTANLLHVSVDTFQQPSPTGQPSTAQLLLASSADRRLHLLATDRSLTLIDSLTHIQDSPILSCLSLGTPHLQTITAGMSGQVVLYDHHARRALDERRDHTKYVVKVALWNGTPHGPHLLATAGWDAKVNLHILSRSAAAAGGAYDALNDPLASVTLPTNPETLLFAQDPATGSLFLVVTRRDSTSLHYYRVHTPSSTSASLTPAGTQNLAPHSNAWIAFSPSALALSPTDPTLLAVATSAVPHMKLLLVRLLFPPAATSAPPAASATQAAQTRAVLARQDREEAAIQLHVNTLAPQTPYSTPQVCWRPDGSGVWVNGDDGVVRGVEVRTGKVVGLLKGGHEVGSKVRSVWAGWVGVGEGREEWVVSGGFDRRLVVWKVGEEGV